MKPDNAKANSLVRTIGIPIAPAAISLSRTATSRRAIPRSRHTLTMSTDRTRTPIENQAKARSDERLKPNRLGRAISVDWGFGSPVQIRLLRSGGVQNGVAS